jgi:hypothetical protein
MVHENILLHPVSVSDPRFIDQPQASPAWAVHASKPRDRHACVTHLHHYVCHTFVWDPGSDVLKFIQCNEHVTQHLDDVDFRLQRGIKGSRHACRELFK